MIFSGRQSPQAGGRFVVIVGPDGVGKTTLARQLLTAHRGPTAYFHFRPLIRHSLLTLPPAQSVPPISKASKAGSVLLGWVRLARNFVLFWISYIVRVLPAKRSGTLVVGDRWAYGYLAQPYALKYYGPPWVARLALKAMPKPDLVVNLSAPPQVIHDRKPELSPEEIRSELAAWMEIPARSLLTVDASSTPDAIAAQVAGEL